MGLSRDFPDPTLDVPAAGIKRLIPQVSCELAIETGFEGNVEAEDIF
jgi:hypothetical protein